MNTHNLQVDFGRHKGELYTRLPVSYLRWMTNNDHSKKDIAEAELERRGTTLNYEMDISGHAIDRASQRFIQQWINHYHSTGEGFHAWLNTLAKTARTDGKKIRNGVYVYDNITFVFDEGLCYPTLKTVK